VVRHNAIGVPCHLIRSFDLVAWYDDRGTSENWIKELKLDIHADRLSCHRFHANAFRLQLHSLALLLLTYFRRDVLVGTRLATATIGTIRSSYSKSQPASAEPSAASGFISRPIGPANHSSCSVTAHWRAPRRNLVNHDIFFASGPRERRPCQCARSCTIISQRGRTREPV
jgi:hypothetical protein